jgi:hypothetical protein
LKKSGLRGAFLLFAKEINKLGSLPENQSKELIDFFEDLFLFPFFLISILLGLIKMVLLQIIS